MSEKGSAVDKTPVRGSEFSLSSTLNPSIPCEHVHCLLLQAIPLNTDDCYHPVLSLSR